MLDTKTAFITGASRGIGREIARRFAEEGANVALASRSDSIYELGEELGETAYPVETDVTDPESVQTSIEATVEQFGAIDCLVNNAGIAGPTAPIEDVEEDEWNRTLDVNVSGYYRTVKYAAPHLREGGGGSIINISSISGKRPLENRTPYTTSKMAVIGLTRTLAVEFGEDAVTVNAICPGPTEGPRLQQVVDDRVAESERSAEEIKEDLFFADAALGEVVSPEDVAAMVLFLASDEGGRITGQDFNVDAGRAWH